MHNRLIPAYHNEFTAAVNYAIINEKSVEQQESAKLIFTRESTVADIVGEFRAVEGSVTDNLSVQSRYVDLLLMPRHQDYDSNLNIKYQLGSVLLSSACPVLVLPDSKPITLPPQRVMVGWDGSRECAAALRAALPMLAQVEKIDVVSVSSDETEATAIATYISRHGIIAETYLIESSKGGVGQALLEQATKLRSQLLVMGAYGHSRLRELVLGGATKYILEHAQLPVLFMH
jgi:nucleotide-binding universal stress UspA family protein